MSVPRSLVVKVIYSAIALALAISIAVMQCDRLVYDPPTRNELIGRWEGEVFTSSPYQTQEEGRTSHPTLVLLEDGTALFTNMRWERLEQGGLIQFSGKGEWELSFVGGREASLLLACTEADSPSVRCAVSTYIKRDNRDLVLVHYLDDPDSGDRIEFRMADRSSDRERD